MPALLAVYADCVASLHEAALEPERWPDALQASMRLFGASGILLTDIDTERGHPRSIQIKGHEPALLQAYAGHYASMDPTIAVGMAGAHGTVYHLREHFSEQQMSRMEYFQDFLFAFGVSDVMATPIDYAPNARLFVSLQRRTGEKVFDARSHPMLGRFVRQINIAKQTEARLLASAQTNTAVTSGLDAFAAAMFILAADAFVRHHNRAAEALLNARRGLLFQSGQLRLSSANANAQLLRALRSASPPMGRATAFTIIAEGGRPLQVITTPLRPGQALNATWQQPLVLVIVSDTREAAASAAHAMQKLYGLTAAESRLVAELAEGKTLREISDMRAVGFETLRSQLKAAFSKTGARRQVDLMRLIAALAPITVDRGNDPAIQAATADGLMSK